MVAAATEVVVIVMEVDMAVDIRLALQQKSSRYLLDLSAFRNRITLT